MMDMAIMQAIQAASVVESRSAPASVTSTPAWVAKPVTQACLNAEAERQNLEPWRLASVMKTEGGRVGQFSLNSDGSYDMGPMQINTIHLKELSALYGISSPAMAQLLAYDGCFNVAVGAFLLRKRTNEAGGDFWYGIGRYHNKRPDLSAKYILKVHQQMQSIVLDGRTARQ